MAVQTATKESVRQLLSTRGITIVMYSYPEFSTIGWVGGAMRRAFGSVAQRYKKSVSAILVDVKECSEYWNYAAHVPDFEVRQNGDVIERFDRGKYSWNAPGVALWLEHVLTPLLESDPHTF